MGRLEQFGDIGPRALNQVPAERPKLNAEGYQKLSVTEVLSRTLTPAERRALQMISSAESLSEIREGMDEFAKETSPKDASEFGLSLDDIEITNHPLALNEAVQDFPDDKQVVLSCSMRGVMSIAIVDKSTS